MLRINGYGETCRPRSTTDISQEARELGTNEFYESRCNLVQI